MTDIRDALAAHARCTGCGGSLAWCEADAAADPPPPGVPFNCCDREHHVLSVAHALVALEPILAEMEERYSRAARMAQIVYDLDRCSHGRHRRDVCNGCGGPSMGNPHIYPGECIGYDISGREYRMPTDYLGTSNPDNWSSR